RSSPRSAASLHINAIHKLCLPRVSRLFVRVLSLSRSLALASLHSPHLTATAISGISTRLQAEMKNSLSDHNLFIDSEEDDDANEEEEGSKACPSEVADDDADGSDSPSDDDCPPRSRPSSHSANWPQSYRQSIDMYSGLASPATGFLGTPTLSRLSSSFFSSFRVKHTPEKAASLVKPLLPTTTADEQLQEERQSSDSPLTPQLPSRKPSLEKIQEKVFHELPSSRNSSYGQAVFNGMNVLCGVGILSTPYAVKEGGWLGLSILLTYAVLAWYTGILLRHCLESQQSLATYPDIGQAAFGTTGRIAISIILYLELYASCVEYIILERDNLSSLFPNAQLNIGHAVFPNIYSSLKKPNQFPSVLCVSFVICTVMYAVVAVMGYTMNGESTLSQFTLNMPQNLLASKVAVWTTLVKPKFLSFGYHIRIGDGFDWIIAHHACDFDSSMCLLFEHSLGQSDKDSGTVVHLHYRNWSRLFHSGHDHIALQNYRPTEFIIYANDRIKPIVPCFHFIVSIPSLFIRINFIRRCRIYCRFFWGVILIDAKV
ncbi:amino acid transporter, partial [Musa troglodytarum]